MEHAEGDDKFVVIDAMALRIRLPENREAEADYGRVAAEDVEEDGGDDVAEKENEKGIVGDHPFLGGQAGEAPVEERDGDFNNANSYVEDGLADSVQLIPINLTEACLGRAWEGETHRYEFFEFGVCEIVHMLPRSSNGRQRQHK